MLACHCALKRAERTMAHTFPTPYYAPAETSFGDIITGCQSCGSTYKLVAGVCGEWPARSSVH